MLKNFGLYTVTGIEDLSLDGGLALLQLNVLFSPEYIKLREKLPESSGGIFSGFGGNSFANPFQKDGVGTATFCFAWQDNGWKLHFVRFTDTKMDDLTLGSINDLMQQIVD